MKSKQHCKENQELNPFLLVQIGSKFITIDGKFKRSGTEFIILIEDGEGLSTHYYTIDGYKKTIELKMNDEDCRSILEYVEKNARIDRVPVIHIDNRDKIIHFLTAPLLDRTY